MIANDIENILLLFKLKMSKKKPNFAFLKPV